MDSEWYFNKKKIKKFSYSEYRIAVWLLYDPYSTY